MRAIGKVNIGAVAEVFEVKDSSGRRKNDHELLAREQEVLYKYPIRD
jgi:hypothetical protein